ncbi:MAG: DUF697 domain-containing protein [Lentisphaerae bacterium]|nr:DUF697 domain-containing protein [Lentisphaerota bacterium]
MSQKITANILVCGKSGVGKTSLVQAMTLPGTVPDEAISDSRPCTQGFDLYQTEVANFIDCQGMEPGQTVEQYCSTVMGEVVQRLDSDKSENLVHAIWYCLNGSGARLQSADAKLIRQFSEKALLIVSKADLMRKEQTESLLAELGTLLPVERIILVSSMEKTGLANLLDETQKVAETSIDQAEEELNAFRLRWEEYYSSMRQLWRSGADAAADELITWAAGRAAAIAIIPLPLADVGPLVANEAYMIYKLGAVYGYAVDKTVLTMLAGMAGGSMAGKLAASFLPFLKIPIAAGITYAVGKAAKAYFASGMSLSKEELRREFLNAEKEAKKTDWKQKMQEEEEE